MNDMCVCPHAVKRRKNKKFRFPFYFIVTMGGDGPPVQKKHRQASRQGFCVCFKKKFVHDYKKKGRGGRWKNGYRIYKGMVALVKG